MTAPWLPPAVRAHPSSRGAAKGSRSLGRCPPGRAGTPQPPPCRCPSPGPRPGPPALAPRPRETQRQAVALTDPEGGRGPTRRRRGWGGCGDGGSAVPIRRVPGLGPSSGRPPGAPARGRVAQSAGGGRGGGGAGAPGRAASRGSERLPAPPARAGTARSDVSAAPPAPSLHPDQCGTEGAEAAAGAPGPAPRPSPHAPRRRALPAPPRTRRGRRAARWEPRRRLWEEWRRRGRAPGPRLPRLRVSTRAGLPWGPHVSSGLGVPSRLGLASPRPGTRSHPRAGAARLRLSGLRTAPRRCPNAEPPSPGRAPDARPPTARRRRRGGRGVPGPATPRPCKLSCAEVTSGSSGKGGAERADTAERLPL